MKKRIGIIWILWCMAAYVWYVSFGWMGEGGEGVFWFVMASAFFLFMLGAAAATVWLAPPGTKQIKTRKPVTAVPPARGQRRGQR